MSFSSIIDVATQLNNNKPLGTLEMGVLYSKIPESIKKEIIDPYISIEDNEARISLRIIDSREDLRRNDFYKNIRLLKKYMSENGKILPSRITNVSQKKQRINCIWKFTIQHFNWNFM